MHHFYTGASECPTFTLGVPNAPFLHWEFQLYHFMFVAISNLSCWVSLNLSSATRQLKASVEEEVNVHRSEIEKNVFKVFKLK